MSYFTQFSLGTIKQPDNFIIDIFITENGIEDLLDYGVTSSEECEIICNQILEGSKLYPDVIFELIMEGDDRDDITYWFFQNGKSYSEMIIMPIFNASKLK